MNDTDRLYSQHVLIKILAFCSIFINSVLISLIIRKSPKNLGPYKYLMKFISVFEIFYSITDYLVLPVMHSHGASFFIFTSVDNTFFNKPIIRIMQGVWCGFFGASMAIFGIHFIYRYLAVTQSKHISTFKGFNICGWFLIPLLSAIIWGVVSYFCCGPKNILTNYIREDLMDSFGLKVEDVVYLGPFFYDNNGNFTLDLDMIVTLVGASSSVGFSLFTISFFGYKCHHALTDNNSHAVQSQNYRYLQRQFFIALVLQTIIPITLMHTPLMFAYCAALLNRGFGKFSNVVSFTIALYPVIDPLPTIFIVKNYREGLKQYLLAPKKLLGKWKNKIETDVTSRRVSRTSDVEDNNFIL